MASDAFEDIVENFELFDEWEDRYRYVIDLGKDMDPLPDARKSDATRVEGCASQVWLVPEVRDEDGITHLYFDGDSDAMIVRGLIAVLKALLSGQPLRVIPSIDVQAELARLGLEAHLSSQRTNGLRAMIQRLKDLAAKAEAA
ncbi:MAG: SufE family protein [Pseudomonadota bacterium]